MNMNSNTAGVLLAALLVLGGLGYQALAVWEQSIKKGCDTTSKSAVEFVQPKEAAK